MTSAQFSDSNKSALAVFPGEMMKRHTFAMNLWLEQADTVGRGCTFAQCGRVEQTGGLFVEID